MIGHLIIPPDPKFLLWLVAASRGNIGGESQAGLLLQARKQQWKDPTKGGKTYRSRKLR